MHPHTSNLVEHLLGVRATSHTIWGRLCISEGHLDCRLNSPLANLEWRTVCIIVIYHVYGSGSKSLMTLF